MPLKSVLSSGTYIKVKKSYTDSSLIILGLFLSKIALISDAKINSSIFLSSSLKLKKRGLIPK